MKRLEDLHRSVLGHITTIEATYQLARMAIELGVPGDFCECGVYAGAQSAAMARAIQDTFDRAFEFTDGRGLYRHPGYADAERRVHLFDSFAGFPELSREHDGDMIVGGHKAGDTACSLADVQKNMKTWGIPEGLLVYHEGWFEDTMPIAVDTFGLAGLNINQIAVLRLDADLYESTKTAMRYLYPLVSPGGWVIVDDWNLDGCREAVSEFVTPAPIMWRKDAL